MFLVSCSYMLKGLIQVLRKEGIPFHNPYRRSNGFWNPLRVGKRSSTPNRILSLLIGHPDYGEGHRAWTHGDLALWAELMQAKGILRHGVKAKLKAGDVTTPVTMDHLAQIFEAEALDQMMAAWDAGSAALLKWWQARLTEDGRRRVEFPADVARRGGPGALLDTPQVLVGTIHSVKGGQADVVYLFPDLSQAGDAQYARGGAPRDSVMRQFYVGATRAREKLYICGQASNMAIPL
ncbi:MAG TPA: ATP-binding domain-containing protein [Bryobacteraceae bacterium]|nr:ATP-binding domain-containing protein [Bryobacteraceae bacterium]